MGYISWKKITISWRFGLSVNFLVLMQEYKRASINKSQNVLFDLIASNQYTPFDMFVKALEVFKGSFD